MTHYIRTIHTSFTSGTPSSSSSSSTAWASSTPYATTSASAHANILVNLGGLMNKYPPGLGHSEWRNSPSGPPPYTRRRNNSISLRAPTSRRSAPPPPTVSRVQPASVTYMKFDPFSDENSPLDSVLYHTPTPPAPTLRSYTSAPRTHTVQVPHVDRDKDARSRLVAGILLNRVHAVGKPMRGRRPNTEPREYVRSGLSRVVSVEA